MWVSPMWLARVAPVPSSQMSSLRGPSTTVGTVMAMGTSSQRWMTGAPSESNSRPPSWW